jgi:hypothetical protein
VVGEISISLYQLCTTFSLTMKNEKENVSKHLPHISVHFVFDHIGPTCEVTYLIL